MRLLTSRFDRGERREISWNVIRIERFDVHFNQADEGTIKVWPIAAAAIHDHADSNHIAAVLADDVDRLLNAASACDHIFRDYEPFTGLDRKSATQDKTARIFLGKDVAFS